jgi:hypothetical protein
VEIHVPSDDIHVHQFHTGNIPVTFDVRFTLLNNAMLPSPRLFRAVAVLATSERLSVLSREFQKFELSEARNVAPVSPLLSVIILSKIGYCCNRIGSSK